MGKLTFQSDTVLLSEHSTQRPAVQHKRDRPNNLAKQNSAAVQRILVLRESSLFPTLLSAGRYRRRLLGVWNCLRDSWSNLKVKIWPCVLASCVGFG